MFAYYNEQDNLWCEYQFDSDIEMYKYQIYSVDGYEYSGYIGLNAIKERSPSWAFVGVL